MNAVNSLRAEMLLTVSQPWEHEFCTLTRTVVASRPSLGRARVFVLRGEGDKLKDYAQHLRRYQDGTYLIWPTTREGA